MQAERLKILRQLVIEEPEDPFNQYALAMELLEQDSKEAKTLMKTLIVNFPQYLPTYYKLGELFLENEELEEARVVVKQGVDVAQKQKNEKAMKELQGLLQIVNDEIEEW